jgi:hypothetical protein
MHTIRANNKKLVCEQVYSDQVKNAKNAEGEIA